MIFPNDELHIFKPGEFRNLREFEFLLLMKSFKSKLEFWNLNISKLPLLIIPLKQLRF